MPPIAITNPEPVPPARARTFGLVGVVLAFFGLAGVIFAPLIFEVQRPPPKQLSDVLVETAVKIKDRVLKGEAPVPPAQTDWRVVANIVASALGFIGAAFGTASWIRREDSRICRAAVAVGVVAIGFHYIMAAVAVVIAFFFIAWLRPALH